MANDDLGFPCSPERTSLSCPWHESTGFPSWLKVSLRARTLDSRSSLLIKPKLDDDTNWLTFSVSSYAKPDTVVNPFSSFVVVMVRSECQVTRLHQVLDPRLWARVESSTWPMTSQQSTHSQLRSTSGLQLLFMTETPPDGLRAVCVL